jgi:hypothetical protein
MCTLSRLKQFIDHCLSLIIMVLLEKMQTNYSVPCHKGDGDNTLATRYNHKIILVYDTIFIFSLTLQDYLTLSPPMEIFLNRAPLFEIFFCAPVLNILICRNYDMKMQRNGMSDDLNVHGLQDANC